MKTYSIKLIIRTKRSQSSLFTFLLRTFATITGSVQIEELKDFPFTK